MAAAAPCTQQASNVVEASKHPDASLFAPCVVVSQHDTQFDGFFGTFQPSVLLLYPVQNGTKFALSVASGFQQLPGSVLSWYTGNPDFIAGQQFSKVVSPVQHMLSPEAP